MKSPKGLNQVQSMLITIHAQMYFQIWLKRLPAKQGTCKFAATQAQIQGLKDHPKTNIHETWRIQPTKINLNPSFIQPKIIIVGLCEVVENGEERGRGCSPKWVGWAKGNATSKSQQPTTGMLVWSFEKEQQGLRLQQAIVRLWSAWRQ